MNLKLSDHAKSKHVNEKWNATTIRDAYYEGRMQNVKLLEGETADILCGEIEGDFVGLILAKENNGVSVIITGFQAPLEYWKSV